MRPGALGDAVLTLPVLRALRGAGGARRVTVLGNPASWAFLRPDAPAVRVCDIDSATWLGLFVGDAAGRAGGAAPPIAPSVRRLLAEIDTAVVYLGGVAGERVAANLRAAGVADVRGAAPPRAGAGSPVTGGPACARGPSGTIGSDGGDQSSGEVGSEGAGGQGSSGPEGADEASHDDRPGRPAGIGESWRRLGPSGWGAVEGASGGIGPAHAAYRLLAGLVGRPGLVGEELLHESLVPPPLADDALLAPTAAELAAARRLLPGGGAGAGTEGPPFLALHPGSGGAAKCWPAERFAALAAHGARAWGLAQVVLFGPADAAVRDAFTTAAAGEGLRWAPVVGRSLREVLAVLSSARAYVGNDSGVTHLAARACPTVALFGPSEPEVWRPLGREVAVLRAPERRMDALTVAPVAAALGRLLAVRPGDARP